MSNAPPLPLAVTMGEPAGIGGEILLKAWARYRTTLPRLFVVDDIARLATIASRLKFDIPLVEYDPAGNTSPDFSKTLPVIHTPLTVEQHPGKPEPDNAQTVVSSISKAVALTQQGIAAGIVTNPIQKSALYEVGFAYPGHTEYLASLSGGNAVPVMMLACDQLRVVPVTIHLRLRDALEALTVDKIVEQGRITSQALVSDFGIPEPHLAVAGLNPHAGENGSMGDEEQTTIQPAIESLKAEGIRVSGPYSPDTLFSAETRKTYDVAICMYHDQALIPIKTLDFDGGVNVTLGLDFIRTSPDHGTALDIAGTGKASERSLVAAIRMADAMAKHRRKHMGDAGG